MSPDPPPGAGHPAARAIEPGPKAPPFSWERRVHPILTREVLGRLAPAGALVVAILVVFAAAMAIVSPESAALTVGATLFAMILVPLIVWAAMAYGNLHYGQPGRSPGG